MDKKLITIGEMKKELITIGEMKKELIKEGWVPKTPTIWKCPDGRLFLGPAQAYRVLTTGRG